MDYSALQGLEFEERSQNCYSLVRSFYKDMFAIDLRDYANPRSWWDYGDSLFMDNFHAEGFQVVDGGVRDLQFGDVVVMAIAASVGNHVAVVVDGGRILHHMVGQRSCVTSYGGLFRNTTVAFLRHPLVSLPEVTVEFRNFLPDHVERKIKDLENSELGSS